MQSEKRSLSLSFFMIIAIFMVVVSGLVLALRLWSIWRLEKTEADLSAISLEGAEIPATYSPAQLEAAAAAAESLSLSREEMSTLPTLCSRPLDQWSDEDTAFVAAAVERNQPVLDEVAASLLSDLEIEPAPPAKEAPFDPQDFSNVGKLAIPLLQASRIAEAGARVAIRSDNAAAAAANLTLLKNLAEGLQGDLAFVEMSAGFHVETLLNRLLLEVVAADIPLFADRNSRLEDFIPQTDTKAALRLTYVEDLKEILKRMQSSSDEEPRGFFLKTLGAIFTPIFKYRQKAMMLENHRFVLGRLNTPFGADAESFLNPPEPPWWQLFRRVSQFSRSGQLNGIGRCQATAALRQILLAAIALRSTHWPEGAYPQARPDFPPLTTSDPFTGQLLEYQLLPNGNLRLGVANGPELLKKLIRRGRNTWLDAVELMPPG